MIRLGVVIEADCAVVIIPGILAVVQGEGRDQRALQDIHTAGITGQRDLIVGVAVPVHVAVANRFRIGAQLVDSKMSVGFLLKNGVVLTQRRSFMSQDRFYGYFFSFEDCADCPGWLDRMTPYEGSFAPAGSYTEPENGTYRAITYILLLPRTGTHRETVFYATIPVSWIDDLFISDGITPALLSLYAADGTLLYASGDADTEKGAISVTGATGLTVTLVPDSSAADEVGTTYGRIAMWFTILYLLFGLIFTFHGLFTNLRLDRQRQINRETQQAHDRALNEYRQELSQRTERIRYYEFMALLEGSDGIEESALARELSDSVRVVLLPHAAQVLPLSQIRKTYPLSYVVGTDIVALADRTVPSILLGDQLIGEVCASPDQIAASYARLLAIREQSDTENADASAAGDPDGTSDISSTLIYHMLQSGNESGILSLIAEYRPAFNRRAEPMRTYIIYACAVAVTRLRETLGAETELPVFTRKTDYDALCAGIREACHAARGYNEAARNVRGEQLIAFILDHTGDQQLCLANTAEAFSMTETEVQRIIHRTQGMSFFAYVEKTRLKEAMRLLRETDQPVGEIAAACGYSNRTTFYRAFRKRYDCRPGDVRKSG